MSRTIVRFAQPLMRTGAAMVVFPAILRALVSTEPLPGWDTDPAIYPYTQAGLGPGATAMLSAGMLLGSALLIVGADLAGMLKRWIAWLALCAAAAPLVHALVLHAENAEQVRIAVDWSAALLAGGALAAALRRGTALHTLLIGVVLGTAGAIACKGAMQVLIEHPALLRDYRVNGEQFLRAQGWAPNSPQALQFERRLRDPVATGWFGLSNVYGSFAAAGFAAFVVWAYSSWRAQMAVWISPVLGTIAVILGWSLWVSGSKGAMAAVVLGIASLLVVAFFGRRKWICGAVGLSAVGLPLLAVVARGMVGERVGELSILFRWFYMQGTAAVFGETFPFGPGPDRFKDWYARLKPEIAPEDVSSPHSVLLDYTGSMGLLAIPAIGLVLVLAIRIFQSRDPMSPPETGGADSTGHVPRRLNRAGDLFVPKPWILAGAFAIALASVWGASLESSMATIEAAMVRLVGIGLVSAGVGAVLMAWLRGGLSPLGLSAAAVVMMAHSQIEMTPIQPVSAGLCLALLGLAGSGGVMNSPRTKKPLAGVAIGLLAGACSVLVAVGPGIRLLDWQRGLRESALMYPHESPGFVDSDAGGVEGLSLNERDALDRQVRRQLEDALALYPKDDRVHRALVENARDSAVRLARSGRETEALELANEVLSLGERMTAACPHVAGAWSLRVSARLALSDAQILDAEPDELFEHARRATELDPMNPQARSRLAFLAERFGRAELASTLAGEAIRLSDLRRLDPLTQLPEPELRELRRLQGR